MYEIYELPQGKIIFSYTSKSLNIGALYLNPHQSLVKHNRPVIEQLIQVVGSCTVKLFEEDKLVQEVQLDENDILTIPANQYHMHTNPNNEISVTIWKFEGDISQVLQMIREDNKRIV